MNQPSNAVSRGVLEALGDFDTPLLANTLDYISDVPTHELYMRLWITSVTFRPMSCT